MASSLFQFLCCWGRRSAGSTLLDDRSRLIPATGVDEGAIIGSITGSDARAVLDRVVFKERMGSIVRSKEGKMVNVNSPLPFNIHNRPLLELMGQGNHMSSSSRSASASTFHESQSPHYNTLGPPPPLRTRSGLHITPLHSAPPSRSRSQSPSSVSFSTSHSDGAGGDEEVEQVEKDVPVGQSGVLGVRLVRKYGTGFGFAGRRGRPKIKKDVDENESIGPRPVDSAEPVGDFAVRFSIPPNDQTTVASDPPLGGTHERHSPTPPPHPQLYISSASDSLELRLQEVGALTASWGD